MGYIGQAPANKAVKTADIEDSAITAAKIADGTVVAGELASDSVTTAKILNANVTTAKLAADAVDGTKLADDAVNSEHYTDGSIDNAHIADDAIDSEHYADGSIDNAHIADDQIDSEHYADGSIDTAHIGATQVTGAKLNNDVISAQTELASAPADTDEFMVSDAGVLKRIDYSLIKGGGITEADQWRLTTNLSVSTSSSVISSNLERVDTVFDKIGSGMSESSGIFTFPSTGIWLVKNIGKWSFAGNDHSCQLEIHVTTDNSSYTGRSVSCDSITQISSVTTRAMTSTEIMLDVTNTSNDKVAFKVHCSSNSTALEGDSTSNRTSFTFIRLGDT